MTDTRPSIQELVRRDLIHREKVGIETYGTPLYPYNGRSAIFDAYEEALDLCVYLRQAIEELTGGKGSLESQRPQPMPPPLPEYADRPEFRAARQRADDEIVPRYSR